MEGFTQLSSGMCSIRTLLRGKHPPLLCQAVQFSAAFNHKKGRANLKKKKRSEVQWSTLLPIPSLFHVHHRKSAAAATALLQRCFEATEKHRHPFISMFTIYYTTSLVFKSSLTEMTEQWCKTALSLYIWGKRWTDSREGKNKECIRAPQFFKCILCNPNWLQRGLSTSQQGDGAGLSTKNRKSVYHQHLQSICSHNLKHRAQTLHLSISKVKSVGAENGSSTGYQTVNTPNSRHRIHPADTPPEIRAWNESFLPN